MIETVNVNKTIVLPVEMAWIAISQIDGLDRWFPMISACKVIGNGEGATRILTLATGEKITDKIESIDHKRRRFQYNRIESPFPVSHYFGTVDAHDLGNGNTQISWKVEIDVSADQRDELASFLKKALAEGITGLEQDLQPSIASTSAQEVSP